MKNKFREMSALVLFVAIIISCAAFFSYAFEDDDVVTVPPLTVAPATQPTEAPATQPPATTPPTVRPTESTTQYIRDNDITGDDGVITTLYISTIPYAQRTTVAPKTTKKVVKTTKKKVSSGSNSGGSGSKRTTTTTTQPMFFPDPGTVALYETVTDKNGVAVTDEFGEEVTVYVTEVVTDVNGEPVTDENGQPVTEVVTRVLETIEETTQLYTTEPAEDEGEGISSATIKKIAVGVAIVFVLAAAGIAIVYLNKKK